MKKSVRLLRCVMFMSVAVAVFPACSFGGWVVDGNPLCTAAGDQYGHTITSDGTGGAIVTWMDKRSGTFDIYVQKVNATGAIQWAEDGVALCTAIGDQLNPRIVPDGTGGAIVAWNDYRNGALNSDIYVQKINASGVVQWAGNGVALCTATGNQLHPTITSDGLGGAVVTWDDKRSGNNYDIYAQRINASGVVQWTTDCVELCTAIGNQTRPEITSDGAAGAIVTWQDLRSGNSDIYAQRISASGVVQWAGNGAVLCAAAGDQSIPTIASDAGGGAIVTWQDYRSGNWDIYAQRINALGAVQWAGDGVALCAASSDQTDSKITSDGFGGAIVAWNDSSIVIDHDIYVQRVSASGVVQWGSIGVALCTATGDQRYPMFVSDGGGGAIVTWHDTRSGYYDIYAQRVNASGVVQWTADGVALCKAAGDRYLPTITSDSTGGAIVTWCDFRSGSSLDIYAQRITEDGLVAVWPDITGIYDVPGDQGGWVRVFFTRSGLDDANEATYPIVGYNIHRRIDDPVYARRIVDEGKPVSSEKVAEPSENAVNAVGVQPTPFVPLGENVEVFCLDGHYFIVTGIPPGVWEVVGTVFARQEAEYVCLAPTVGDSAASIPYSVYCVSAHTTTPSVYYWSPPDSGYSVDNLSPTPPGGLAGDYDYPPAELTITWDENVEHDLSHYAVYKGDNEGFVPDEGNRIGTPGEATFVDASFDPNVASYYKVSALDIHGNESGYSLLRPEDITGVSDVPSVPNVTFLEQNVPNPFNPATVIRFALAEAGQVKLVVYDVAGRAVRTLVEGRREARRYEVTWDGRDDRGVMMASGVYIYKLEGPAYSEAKNMVLLK